METKYFRKEEFRCKCGCGAGFDDMSTELLGMLDLAREKSKIPFNINSAYRCKKHNKNVGGVAGSSHLKGLAVDIACVTESIRAVMIKALIEAGFCRIGINNTFIHVDVDKSKNKIVGYYKGYSGSRKYAPEGNRF